MYPSHPSPSQHSYQQHQQPQQQPTGLSRLAVQQSAPAHAAAAPADDDSGPEEGEIEEGEVLPDGTVADSQAVDGSRNDVDMNGHASSHDEPTNGIRQHDRAEHQRDAGTAKQPRADASPRAGASGKKRNRSPTSYADPADDTHAHRDRPPSPQHGAVAADSNARKRQHSNSPKAPVAVERQ